MVPSDDRAPCTLTFSPSARSASAPLTESAALLWLTVVSFTTKVSAVVSSALPTPHRRKVSTSTLRMQPTATLAGPSAKSSPNTVSGHEAA